jgi:hypothetical protein
VHACSHPFSHMPPGLRWEEEEAGLQVKVSRYHEQLPSIKEPAIQQAQPGRVANGPGGRLDAQRRPHRCDCEHEHVAAGRAMVGWGVRSRSTSAHHSPAMPMRPSANRAPPYQASRKDASSSPTKNKVPQVWKKKAWARSTENLLPPSRSRVAVSTVRTRVGGARGKGEG